MWYVYALVGVPRMWAMGFVIHLSFSFGGGTCSAYLFDFLLTRFSCFTVSAIDIICHVITVHLHPHYDMVGSSLVSIRWRYPAGNDFCHSLDVVGDILCTSRGDCHGDGDQYNTEYCHSIDGLRGVFGIDFIGTGQLGRVRVIVRALMLYLCRLAGDHCVLFAAATFRLEI